LYVEEGDNNVAKVGVFRLADMVPMVEVVNGDDDEVAVTNWSRA
jgi:hypothetical protein